MQDAGCPVGRHELTNHDWIILGEVKRARDRIGVEELKERQGRPE